MWFRPLKTSSRDSKFTDCLVDGIFIGTVLGSGENIVAAKDGYIYKAGAIKRRPPEERWSPDWLRQIKGTPASPSVCARDGGMHPYAKPDMLEEGIAREQFVPSREPGPEPRNFSIFKSDVQQDGHTEGCPGCRGLLKGYRDAHSASCRQRFLDTFSRDPRRQSQMDRAEARNVQATVRESERQWRREGKDPKAMQTAEAAGQDAQVEGETLIRGR